MAEGKENVEELDFFNTPKGNLQDGFSKFRQQKVQQHRNREMLKEMKAKERQDPEFRAALRQKFIDRAKHYIGVPYARKYHEPGSDAYNSPIFLDCCALVRQVVYDLREDFGFSLGRWNQAYQYDVCKEDIPFEEMVPGDLVFYSATYYEHLKKKPQIHNMVHVEIYVGPGEETVGSRWNNGRIQVFDSYKFESKNYYDIKYHFKSLDTWLEGICQSWNPDYPWRDDRKDAWTHGRSVFADSDDEEEETKEEIPKQVFYLGSGNNNSLIKRHMVSRGWRQLPSSFGFSNKFSLKWTQTHPEIDFKGLVEGQQLANHIPGTLKALASKHAVARIANNSTELAHPKSYNLSDRSELLQFNEENLPEGSWICKPLAANQGRGIKMIHDIQAFREAIQSGEENKNKIIQKYVDRPLLIGGRKFDIRCFALIARTEPWLVMRYDDYYLRFSLNQYDLHSEDLCTHLTNAAIQKKHPDYKTLKETSIYPKSSLVETVGAEAATRIEDSMFQMILTVFQAGKVDLGRKTGCFELLGCDFLIDEELNPWLLEINTNPALFTDTTVQNNLLPKLVQDTLDVELRINNMMEMEGDIVTGTGYSTMYVEE